MSVSVTSLVCKRAQQSRVVCAKASGTACCILLLIKMAMLEYRFGFIVLCRVRHVHGAVVSEKLSTAACSFLGGLCAVFVAAHGPTETCTSAVRNLFWNFLDHTMTQLRLVFCAFKIIVLIDGTARLDSVPSIEGCHCTKESPNGMTLRCMCELLNL